MLKIKTLGGIFLLGIMLSWAGCGDEGGKKPIVDKNPNPPVKSNLPKAPDFSADSAYAYIENQVAFGPRVPGSQAHQDCAKWITAKLKTLAPKVEVQGGSMKAMDGKTLSIRNIIASFNPEAAERIMLTTHWDSRPWADEDPDPANHTKPVPGANDASSGVGVLMEIARQLKDNPPPIGVDIFLWDAEDYGKADAEMPDSYCLGSQFWAKNPHTFNYSPKYGINLDMVGGHAAQFPKEGFSQQYAPNVVSTIWQTAAEIGYGNYFINLTDSPITDDHVYVNVLAKIPCADIIARDPNRGNFFQHWHTIKDDMDAISKPTLKAVGQTVLEVVFREGAGS